MTVKGKRVWNLENRNRHVWQLIVAEICYDSKGKTCLEFGKQKSTRVATDSSRGLCGSETGIGQICERFLHMSSDSSVVFGCVIHQERRLEKLSR